MNDDCDLKDQLTPHVGEVIDALTALNSYLSAILLLENKRTESGRSGLVDVITRCQAQQRRAGMAIREVNRLVHKMGGKGDTPSK